MYVFHQSFQHDHTGRTMENRKNMGFPEQIILLLKVMYDEQKATVRTTLGPNRLF